MGMWWGNDTLIRLGGVAQTREKAVKAYTEKEQLLREEVDPPPVPPLIVSLSPSLPVSPSSTLHIDTRR